LVLLVLLLSLLGLVLVQMVLLAATSNSVLPCGMLLGRLWDAPAGRAARLQGSTRADQLVLLRGHLGGRLYARRRNVMSTLPDAHQHPNKVRLLPVRGRRAQVGCFAAPQMLQLPRREGHIEGVAG
jgi:hypothetical protein